ncbi:hypothetical protein F4804DRAFT_337317 [Jackrogersella minutella]|nr:hypothetical protein F4804DRAFT_337317 [Jackrogersella minutella]
MASCIGGFRAFLARLQNLVDVKAKPSSSSSEKVPLQISAPFNFKHETVSLPGLSEDDQLAKCASASTVDPGGRTIAVLKEQAAANRLGVADPSAIGTPRKAPTPPALRPVAPVVKITPSTPISPTENLI